MVPPAGTPYSRSEIVQAVPAQPPIWCPGSGDRAVRALGPAGAELQHRSPLGRPDDRVGLGHQASVVDGQQGLDGRRPDRHHRLPGKIGVPSGTAQMSPVKRKSRR